MIIVPAGFIKELVALAVAKATDWTKDFPFITSATEFAVLVSLHLKH
ncbi:MAG: hypothetical protein ACTSWC_04790 [Promethearchaeota archaeon]